MGGLWAGEGALLELEVRSLGEWRDWLAANHAQPESIWLVSWKARRRDLYIPYRDLVTEAPETMAAARRHPFGRRVPTAAFLGRRSLAPRGIKPSEQHLEHVDGHFDVPGKLLRRI